jgi:hypothetical protein
MFIEKHVIITCGFCICIEHFKNVQYPHMGQTKYVLILGGGVHVMPKYGLQNRH